MFWKILGAIVVIWLVLMVASAIIKSLIPLAIILFLASWNNYLWPLLIASEPTMMTAPVALGTLIGVNRVSWASIMTGAVLLTLPMVIVFIFLQRFFMAGITTGAVK